MFLSHEHASCKSHLHTLACSSEIRFAGSFSSSFRSKSKHSRASGPLTGRASLPMVAGISYSAVGMTCMRRYSFGASNGV